MSFHISLWIYLRDWLENRIRQAKRSLFKLPSISHFNIKEIKAKMEEMDRRITNLEARIAALEGMKRYKIYKFDWSFDLDVLWLIWGMREKRNGFTAKKVDVLNRAADLGMGRERTEQAIDELIQLGEIIEIKGGDIDWDRLRIVNEERFYKYRRRIAEDRVSPED